MKAADIVGRFANDGDNFFIQFFVRFPDFLFRDGKTVEFGAVKTGRQFTQGFVPFFFSLLQ